MCYAAQLLGRTLSPTGVVEVDDALNVVAADDVLTSKCSSRPPDAWFPGITSPPVAVRPSEPGSHRKSLPETGMTSFLLTGESTLLFWCCFGTSSRGVLHSPPMIHRDGSGSDRSVPTIVESGPDIRGKKAL